MSDDDYSHLLRDLRSESDPSTHEFYTLEPTHLEVQYQIKAQCGVRVEIQNTRHQVVLSLENDLGAFQMALEHTDFDDVDGVVFGVLECFAEDPDLLDLLVESGYRRMRR